MGREGKGMGVALPASAPTSAVVLMIYDKKYSSQSLKQLQYKPMHHHLFKKNT